MQYETPFVTAKDKIYVKRMGGDDSEDPHVELQLTKRTGVVEETKE
jgi:hypothetical protein